MLPENDEGEVLTTDAAILDSIGEGDEPTTTDGATEETTVPTTDPTGSPPAASSDKGTDQGAGDKPAKSASGPQDIVGRDGQVLAAGGRERRFYETAQREKLRADQATTQVTTLTTQLDAVNKAGNVGTQYNLSPEEVSTGAQLIAAYKDNPVETIKYMLTQAQSSGHNVDTIVSGGTDMSAVKSMLDNALAPLLGDRQAEKDTQEVNTRALEIYNTFSAQYPDAVPHENSLARLLKADPNLSPEAAYFKLQNHYLQKGWDWTKSVEQLQQEAIANGSTENTRTQPPDGGINSNNVVDADRVADVNTSTDDIIREAIREAGIT
jgi:hypothetical protein